MLFVELTQEMQISGLLSFIHNLITIFISIAILRRAIQLRKGTYYVLALFMLFSAAGYYQIGLNYLFWIFTNELFRYEVKVLIGTAGIGIATLSWLYIYFDMLFTKLKKKVIIIYSLFVVIFYVYLITFLFVVPDAPVEEIIGINVFPYEINYSAFVLISFMSTLIITTITTYHLAFKIMKSKDNKELVWRGRFLAIGITLIMISAILDINAPDIIPLTISIRITGIIAIFFIYLGFVPPNWVKKFLRIEE
jgi:hypothetical protein